MNRASAQSEAPEIPTSTISVAAVNMNVTHDKAANLRKIETIVTEAAGKGIRLIVFPEQALQGCMWSLAHDVTAEEWLSYRAEAEFIPGQSTDWFTARAARRDTVIVFGMTERRMVRGRETLYNSCPIVGPSGLIGVYRKVHLVGDEVHIFSPGDGWQVYDTPVGKLGSLICYDCQFPEAARSLVLGGAQMMVMPTAWPATGDGMRDDRGCELYDLLTRVRAQENQTWLVAADQVGPCDIGEMRFHGHSRVVAPTGRVVAEVPLEEGMATAHIDLIGGFRESILETLPPGLDYIRDRRPDTYGRVCMESPPSDPTRTGARSTGLYFSDEAEQNQRRNPALS